MSTNSLLFDGVDEHVVVGDVSALQFERTAAFSLSCWFKALDDGAAAALIAKQESAAPFRGYNLILLSDGRIRWQLSNDNTPVNRITAITIQKFADATWHHVAATYDGSSTLVGLSIYVDGALRGIQTDTDALSATILTTAPFQIGARNGTNLLFNGLVDEAAVYDKELTSGEVTTIYNSGDPPDLTSVGPTGNLVGLWEMGESATFPTIPDVSTNSNDGTMTNMESGDIVTDIPSTTVFAASANSLLFGGVDEFVTVGDVAALQFERTDAFSLSCWFRSPGVTGTDTLVAKQESSVNFRGYLLSLNSSGGISVRLRNTITTNELAVDTTTTGFDDDDWHHVVVAYDGGSAASGVTVYVDGIPRTLSTVTDTLSATISNSIPFQIGATNAAIDFMEGNLDWVGVYDKELTEVEAVALYGGRKAPDLRRVGSATNLVGFWRMGDGATFPTIVDESASGNDGTMTNMESGDIVTDAHPLSPVLPAAATDLDPVADPQDELLVDKLAFNAGGGTEFFKMRALADPGPGYEVWVVQDEPDFTGTGASGPIQAGTAVVATSWTVL